MMEKDKIFVDKIWTAMYNESVCERMHTTRLYT